MQVSDWGLCPDGASVLDNARSLLPCLFYPDSSGFGKHGSDSEPLVFYQQFFKVPLVSCGRIYVRNLKFCRSWQAPCFGEQPRDPGTCRYVP